MSRLTRLIRRSEAGKSQADGSSSHAPTRFESRTPHGATLGLAAEAFADPEQVARVQEPYRQLIECPGVRDLAANDLVPLPAVEDRENYLAGANLAYWLSGLSDLRLVEDCVPQSAFDRVLDFGGASGRFARHVSNCYEQASVTIAELSRNHVDWVDEHFGTGVRAVKVSPYPHIPLSDESQTLAVGFSVFTHIDAYETSWLAELHRVLKPGAHAVMTIHSEHSWEIIESRPWLFGVLMEDPSFRELYRPGNPMPEPWLSFSYDPNSIEHNCNVFSHTDHIYRRWGKWFDVVEIRPRSHVEFQTTVVLRKPES